MATTGYTLNQLIGWTAMQGMIETPVGGVQSVEPLNRILAQTVPLEGLTAEWTMVENSRQTAAFNDHGAESRAMDQEGISTQSVKCMHVLNHITHKSELLSSLRDMNNPARQQRASQVIEYQTREFKRKHDNQKVTALCSALVANNIYTDASGNILPSSSGAKRTVSFGATYTGSAAIAYNTTIAGDTTGDWRTATTPIAYGIGLLQKWYGQVNGRRLRYGIYGADVPTMFADNDYAERWQSGSAKISEALSSGTIPEGFFGDGIMWIPGNNLGYKDSGGTYRYWLADDEVLFLPEIDRSWIEVQNGTEELPAGTGTFDDAPEAVRSGLRTANGAYTMCHIPPTPPAKVIQYMGDNYMFALKEATAPVLFNASAT